ncbi:MAG: PAS domain-containing protein [Methanomicrobiaceae archaeon]|uniref:sensor histidine kinase n=1 Tax=Methanoculleus sp. TaxID=90427 RepID=UPI00320F3AB1|nr:PAS domain-containing protein [Methanomicrobiaceae archaeon]
MNQERVRTSMNRSQIPMSIIEHLQQPALVLDCEGRVIVWNNSMERYTGISARDIVGKGGYAHGEALFGERLPTLANCILNHSDAGSDHYRLLPPEGEELLTGSRITPVPGREVVCMAAPLYDSTGRRIGAVETIRDTPEERSVEEPFGTSAEQVQILASSLPDMIFTLNRDGIFSQFFWTGAREMGVVPEEVVGKTPHALFPAEEADYLIGAARRVIAGGEVVAETRSFSWHGGQRSFQVTIHPLHGPSGRVVAATGVSRDITRDLLRERTLQETSRLSSLYLDLLGTDIYNTNMVAATIIEMLRERLSGEEAELAQRVKNTVEQGINVIKNVELYNTLNKHRIRLEPVDLDRIVRGQIRRYAGIDIRYEGESHMVWANPLLEHIVSNLISNSIKFGGMKVRIDISIMETEDTVTLTVADTGIGIPDHLKPNIFDRFSRESKTAAGSRGLGLHIVKTLANQYGGRVWAADRVPGRPGEGAAIKVILQKC